MRPLEEPTTVAAALRQLARHPVERLLRHWNWKAALTSSLIRGLIFFAVNLTAGVDAAKAAFVTEAILRALTSGFYGAVTQTFRSVQPAVAGTAAASVLMPVLSHTVELVVHWWRGTEALAASIGASVAFTAFSTAFNLHLMRHGVMIVGHGSQSLWSDMRALPRLILRFIGLHSGGPRSLVGTGP